MTRPRGKRAVLLFLFFLVLPHPFWAAGTDGAARLRPAEGNYDFGLVVNAKNLLGDLDSYEGGIGAKISTGRVVLRGAVDLLVNTDFNPFSVTLAATFEKHFLPGRISPYWGIFGELGYTRIKTESGPVDWILQTTFPFTLGGLLGVEIFVFDFLSLFVEYGLPLTLGIDTTKTSVAGSVTSSSKFIYKLDAGLANRSMIGIVIYFLRRKP